MKEDVFFINEIFYSLQGEGYWTGTPMIFIRFSGCNLNCSFCDTDHEKGYYMSSSQIEHKIISLLRQSNKDTNNNIRLRICFTGGEPLTHPVLLLLNFLKTRLIVNRNWSVFFHIETNGSINDQQVLRAVDWITVSPKSLNTFNLKYADEVKIVVNHTTDKLVESIWEMYENIRPVFNCQHLFLQPESNNPKYIDKIIGYIKAHEDWRLSLQCQKLIGIK